MQSIYIEVENPKSLDFKKTFFIFLYIRYKYPINRILFDIEYPNFHSVEIKNKWYTLNLKEISEDILDSVNNIIEDSNISIDFSKSLKNSVSVDESGKRQLHAFGNIIIECMSKSLITLPKKFNEDLFNKLLIFHMFNEKEKIFIELEKIEQQHVELDSLIRSIEKKFNKVYVSALNDDIIIIK